VRRWIVIAVLAGIAATGCGGGGDGVRVEGAWARTSPAMADAGAVYLDITSGRADRLSGASVDPSVAGRAEIHETVPVDPDAEDGMGAMAMQEVGSIDLPAGRTVSLEPGGYHIMLMALAGPLETGSTFELTLELEEAGALVVGVEVRLQAP
jgi:copper(I)-binding protein